MRIRGSGRTFLNPRYLRMANMRKTRRTLLAGLGGIALGGSAVPLLYAKENVKSADAKHHLEVSGEIYQLGDTHYEQARRNAVWQAIKPDRFPQLIVNAKTEEDVIATIQYARSQGLQVAVRGVGHNYVASYLREGGILLNVSQLRDIEIDVDARVAHVQPGILGAEFSAILAGDGLAFPVAHCPTVPLGGYLLGGGMGWNGEHWNRFACFNVEAIDLVTAAGERLTISRNVHPDLFWAARGAGPAFCGVVTRYHLKVFALPRAIVQSTYVFSIDQIDNIIAWLEEARHRQDSKIELSFIMEDNDSEKQCVLSAVCFADNEDEGRTLLHALLKDKPEQGLLFAKESDPVTFAEVLALTFTSAPSRLANETAWSQAPQPAVKVMAEHFLNAPAGKTVIIANYRSNTDLPEDAACSVTAPLFLNWSTRWDSETDDGLHMQWMDELADSLEPVISGCYVNETDLIRRPHWARKCFSEANWKRLAGIHKRYDPDTILPPAFLSLGDSESP